MAELSFEAPLAQFDIEEWNEFHDFQTVNGVENSNAESGTSTERNDESSVDNFNETFSGSLEDLVNTFDEKLTKCFHNYEDNIEKIAPVQLRTQEEIMNDCQMWWTITGNFGNILPIDWSKSHTRQLQEQSLNLSDRRDDADSPDLDLSDDDDLHQAFDIHSLIISNMPQDDEPVYTADEVITEIEGMMEEDTLSPESPSPSGSDVLSAASSELLHFKEKRITSGLEFEDSLQELSHGALNQLLEELELTIKDYSETLITELALRDELEYEKELKNQFISLLLSIQKKRRDAQNNERTKKTSHLNALNRKLRGAGAAAEPGTYLTTVIPYHANVGPPSTEQLQIYIKILTAINEDSSVVPGLLTDYILKVLCPTT
ncbi:hypothetical protein CAPTEDRAFT_168941 [Capitella teleta]|uniref:Fasciculation and elongation protein zeta-2 n=1 Tax=Capitella teleta TaxID=283909 RepID=R7UEZ7_CAPTE|nr:hypothetical protein CAPTEDRAFT_168941 [Capitella teleta]|eukprot:ELU04544.1 hypothetical protein CAPTEDRAFT_168941 [Capitella teleta]